jgi:hypothetical protein
MMMMMMMIIIIITIIINLKRPHYNANSNKYNKNVMVNSSFS